MSSAGWKAFFDAHAPNYEQNSFTKWTQSEVSFLESLLGLSAGMAILDIGCGTGRHSVEFAERGYRVVGIDLSSGMLDQARSAAKKAGVAADFVEADATNYRHPATFDVALCLCEGGFGLVDEGDEPVRHDLSILETAFANLKPGGRFVLTALNGYMTIRQMTDELVQAGAFDPATMISQYEDTWKLPEGETTLRIRERLFIAPEVVAMMRHVGFEVLHVWGGTAGEWGQRPLKLDEIEAMYVARRPG